MKRLVLALAAATMVALSVPANAQRIYVGGDTPWAAGPRYHYDNLDRTYNGGLRPPDATLDGVTPRAPTTVYDAPPDPDRYSRAWDAAYAGYAYGGRYVGYRSWDGPYVTSGGGYRYRGWWRGW